MSNSNQSKLDKSYNFLLNKKKQAESFTIDELCDYTDWKPATAKTYLSKKWKDLVSKKNGKYYNVNEKFDFTLKEYNLYMSQVQEKSTNYQQSFLSTEVELLIKKSRDSAILAIDSYNRPQTSFRTQGFTVLMIIAWTSLLHSIFEKNNVDYFYKDDNNVSKMIDGDKKAWELSKCITEFGKLSVTVESNLRLFIKLRNKIEHRYSPVFDLDICGHCQCLLFNYEELLTSTFGNEYSLNSSLTIPLQVVKTQQSRNINSMKNVEAEHYWDLKNLLEEYQKSLPFEVYSSMDYCFRVFLVPKTGNNVNTSDLAIEFIKYDPENTNLLEDLNKQLVIIKERNIQVANQGKYKPKAVSEKVSNKLHKPFTVNHHTKAWKYFDVRKSGNQAAGCDTRYCQFDEAHDSYVYTQNWINFLINNLSNENEYLQVINYKEK
ncbi:DUF3644 domain-containing protein [Jeotgalibaca caeni]|uniref:DUF3644 domain-containing protein n=1 Tax=Jeotgalibaca caeni TaxID=3028623 RepID=UPI00237E0DD4|nr:DUF3644 domain-containing protein [Jeotgalibaca caeni]MDE1549979.1 DUF3644 domain-containing protein [Jeotgalibaca caeni]